jgi:hypothetical protein
MYAKLLQPSQGGSMNVRKLLVRGGGAIVPRNVRELSEELHMHSVEMSAGPSGSPSQVRPINSDMS